MTQVVVVIGAGSIGQAIARRVSAGRHVLLADLREEGARTAATILADAGFAVSTAAVDVASRESVRELAAQAARLGELWGVIHAAGVSPSQASPATILSVDLYGTAVVLEEFGKVIAPGGSGVVIASQSGHRLPALTPEQDEQLATTPADDLLALPWLSPQRVLPPGHRARSRRSARRRHRPSGRARHHRRHRRRQRPGVAAAHRAGPRTHARRLAVHRLPRDDGLSAHRRGRRLDLIPLGGI